MKRIRYNMLQLAMVISFMIVTVLLCPLLATAAVSAPSAELTILHLNDTHGRTQAEPYVAQMVEDLRDQGKNVLLFDAGDRLHGQTTTNLSSGASMVEIMNAVGYDAMTPGNHDFNFGRERLEELSGMMDFPLLAANVRDDEGLLFDDYEIFSVGDLKIGVFGVVTPETVTASDPRIVSELTFDDPDQTATLMVEELEVADCDVIIALAHMGDSPSSTATDHSDALAAVPGVDVIIDGHSHSYLPEGKVSGEALIAQTGQYGENIGVVKLTINDEQITKTAELIAIPVVDESEEPSADEAVDLLPLDEAILEIVTLEDEKTAPITDAVVGEAPVLLQGERELVRTQDTNLAHLIVDSMRWTTGADIAFLSAGNIRAEIPEGEITMGEVLTTLPFSNLIVSVEMGGSDVLAMLEYGVSLYPESTAVHIQISGLQFKFDPALPAGSRVTGVTMVDGSALDPDGRYTVATIEFLAAGGDGYEMVSNGTDLKYYGGDAEVFVDYLATNPTIETEAEARVQAVSGDAGASVRPTIFIILATMLVIVVIIVVVITIRGRKKH